MDKSTAIIIQARTGSTRLPNKMIIPFYNDMGILELILKRLKQLYHNKYKIIIATTTKTTDDIIENIGIENDISVFRGSENDVLLRFIDASKKHNIKNIIRVCADNPMLEVSHIKELIKYGMSGGFDYVSYKLNNMPVIKSHLGLFTEFTTLKTLEKVNSLTTEKRYHEHVTNYIYENNNLFKVELLQLKDSLKSRDDLRFTLDTKEDFKNLQDIYSDIEEDNISDIDKLIKVVDNNPDYIRIMKKQIKENSK